MSARSKHLFRELVWGSIYLAVRLFCRVYEPIVTRTVRNVRMRLNWSHSLPFLVRINKYHDQPLPKFCSFYSKLHGPLTVIDAGANIGDTALLIDAEAPCEILSVEASKKFHGILESNIANKKNIVSACCYLGERDEVSNVTVENDMGNGVAKLSTESNTFRSIDSLVNDSQYSAFKNCSVIKTDVEGFDFKVLRGAKDLIAKNHPAIFFEFHVYYLQQNNEDILGFFKFLNQNSYSSVLAYTQSGFPLGIFKTDDADAITGLTNYCLINFDTYFDILCLPNSQEQELRDFYQSEINRFERHHW